MEKTLFEAMNEVSSLNETDGIAVKGGKKYTQVVTRVEVFRKHFGLDYGIETQVSTFAGGVLFRALIKKDDVIYGTGHAYASTISGEKNLEKLETTAIGRALASVGLSGGEYASDVEMTTWEGRYKKGINPIDKTGNKEIDDGVKQAMSDINAAETPELAKSIAESRSKILKDIGATEEQLGVISDQLGNKLKQFEEPKRAREFLDTAKDDLVSFDSVDQLSGWMESNQKFIDSLDKYEGMREEFEEAYLDRLNAIQV